MNEVETRNEDALRAELLHLRAGIDDCDWRLVECLDARAGLAKKIGEVKRRLRVGLIDETREREVVDRLVRNNLKAFPEPALRSIYQLISAAMVELQIGSDRRLWHVEGDEKIGYMLMSGDRIMLHVEGGQHNRALRLAEWHNEQVRDALVRS